MECTPVTGPTRLRTTLALILATLVWITIAADPLAAAAARERYMAALTHERTLRAPNGTTVTRTQLHAAIARYEALVSEYPDSEFSDHALWQAAGLAIEALQRHGRPSDRETAIRLLERLRQEYPSSALTPRIPGRLALIGTLTRAARPPAPVGAPVLVRAVTREPMADLVRVTIELDDEVPYRSERLDGPARLYFDLAGAYAERPLRDATLAFEDGDVVRKIRLGRHPEQTTRVVLDLEGVESYRVHALHQPYRLVVDATRTSARQRRGAPARIPNDRARLDMSAIDDTSSTVSRYDGSELLPVPEGWSVEALAPIPPVDDITPDPAPAASVASSELAWPRVHDMLYPALGTAPSGPRPAGEPASTAPQPAPRVTRHTPLDRPPISGQAGPPAPSSTHAASRPAPVDRAYSLGRQLGLGVSRVVIDPGHGGSDPGAQTAGLSESALVLDIAERLAERLRAEGVEVVLTRQGDMSLPLRSRTEIANRANADLFLSIHANAAPEPQTRGIETYYLDFASDPAAQALAARENAVTREGMRDLAVLVESITLRNKVDESRAFAELVQARLISGVRGAHPRVQDLGVKRAPFVVLIGAGMPSVLTEISFLTNPEEAALLATDSYRDEIAEALCTSITEYQRILKSGGQSWYAAASHSR